MERERERESEKKREKERGGSHAILTRQLTSELHKKIP